jgi:hypothetical protein
MNRPALGAFPGPDRLEAAARLARARELDASLAALRDYFDARSTALPLRAVRECEPLLLEFLRAGMQAKVSGLCAFLYGQGSREPQIVLQAFSEFLDADNVVQANRFLPYVDRMDAVRPRIELARFHFLRGHQETAARELGRAFESSRPAMLDALFSSSHGVYRAGRAYTLRNHGALSQCLSALTTRGEIGVDPAIADAAVRTAHVPALRAISRRAAHMLHGAAADRKLASEILGEVLNALLQSEATTGIEDVVAAGCAADPGNPRVGLVQLRLERRKLCSPELLRTIAHRLDPSRPGHREAVEFAVRMLYLDGHAAAAMQLLHTVAGRERASAPAHAVHLNMHQGAATQARLREPTIAILRLDLRRCGRFAPALAALADLANLPHRHGDQPSAAEIIAAGENSERRLTPTLDPEAEHDLGTYLNALEALTELAGTLRNIAMFPDTAALEFGPAYGSSDPLRHRALLQVVHRHTLVLTRRALGQAVALGQTVDIGWVLDVAQRHTRAANELAIPEAALPELDRIASAGAESGHLFVRQLQERCGLSLPPVNTTELAVHGDLDGVEAHRHVLQAFDAWAEQGRQLTALDEEAISGRFDTVGVDGRLTSHAHLSQAQRISVVQFRGCRALDSWLLLNAQGALLRPPHYGLLSGDYPFASEHLLNRGRHAAVLAHPANWRKLREPLLLLGHQDLLHHANYYHWLVQILARICWADDAGLLTGRKLLLPVETRPWMDETLRLCGFGEDHIIRYERSEALHIEDTAVISPVAFASPTLLAALRARLWRGAGVSAPTGSSGSRLIYLSRKETLRRTLRNEGNLAEIAQAEGFEVIVPEALSVTEQIRLLASAHGLVAPGGAGVTNTIFAGQGLRSLMLLNDGENYPTFADLALLCGQSHRCLFGRADTSVAGQMSLEDAPYWIDEASFAQHVRWVACR